jgi:hypothetical protein
VARTGCADRSTSTSYGGSSAALAVHGEVRTVKASDVERVVAFVARHPDFFRLGAQWAFDNWAIVKEFEAATLALVRAGHRHYGARTIAEKMRYESSLRERGPGDIGPKLNNNSVPDLARIFALLHPAHVDFFEFRRGDHSGFRAALQGVAT